MNLEFDFTQPYYNSIPLSGAELITAEENAESQEKIIESFFKCNPVSEFTPFNIQDQLGFDCINSVRRAISNLEDKGVIIKTGNFLNGKFGKKNNCWKLND